MDLTFSIVSLPVGLFQVHAMGQAFLPLLEAPLDLTFGIVLEGQDFS
jgi:hypothetical protein